MKVYFHLGRLPAFGGSDGISSAAIALIFKEFTLLNNFVLKIKI
jgi:hypothetical protein